MAEVGIIGGTPAIRLIVKFRFAKMDYIKQRLETKEHLNFVLDTVELDEA